MIQSELEIHNTLITIKDYIRWGASRFYEAELFFGHGTDNAIDDAAAIVLHALNLPYHLPSTYFDAKLSQNERENILALFERRINEKIPSAYITNEAVFADLSFYVDERVLVPRSPIAEVIKEQFSPWLQADKVKSVLDLCTGSGCIAIALAYAFPDAAVDALDCSHSALEVARINIDKHDLDNQVMLVCSDLFSNLAKKKYDLIVSNPPYVSLGEWQALPEEFHAEPELGFTAGETGLDLAIKILAQSGQYLAEQGILVVEVGISASPLQTLFPNVPFYWLDFEQGGDGVLLLTADQVREFTPLFNETLNSLCQETP